MDVETDGRFGNKRVHNRLGPGSGGAPPSTTGKVCNFWRAGRCNRFPCPYLHSELPEAAPPKRSAGPGGNVWRNSNSGGRGGGGGHNRWGKGPGGGSGVASHKPPDRPCKFWLAGDCTYGERCRYPHSYCISDSITMLTPLSGHEKVITGIALPTGSDKLYSGSKDGTVRMWDCQTGQCAGVINMGCEVGCMISEGPWLFVGIPDAVKVWNMQTAAEMNLAGPTGQVYALAVASELLFAATQDGRILAWKFSAATNCFEPAASLVGHKLAVVSLVVWDLATLQCIQTLSDHTDVVMSVLCWDQFLLSCSLDQTIKVWAATESGNLEVTYTHKEEQCIGFARDSCSSWPSSSSPATTRCSGEVRVRGLGFRGADLEGSCRWKAGPVVVAVAGVGAVVEEEEDERSRDVALALLEAAMEPPEEDEDEAPGEVREEDQMSLSVGIVGAPNAGKSSLTNTMVGTKVAAVSRKTNTTTHEILGVLTKGNTQICFFDTPGLMLGHHGFPHRDVSVRVESAWSSINLYDLLIVMFDVNRHLKMPDSRVIKLIKRLGAEVNPNQRRILCMNKVDLVEDKKDLLKVAKEFEDLPGYERYFMVSGLKGKGVKDLVQYLMDQAIRRPWDEEPTVMTEEVMKTISLEVVREKMLHHIHQEIPYVIEHRLMDWKELKDGSLRVEQHFIAPKQSQRQILVGKNGSKIGRIGIEANEELRSIFKREVHLILQVRVAKKRSA